MRTDIHRPGSELFDPEKYDFVSCFYLGESSTEQELENYKNTIASLKAQGLRAFGFPNQCAHCGARISYLALMVNRATGEFLHIGETCLSNRFHLTQKQFQILRETQRLNRERATKSERSAKFLQDNPEVQELLDFAQNNPAYLPGADFLSSLIYQFERDGHLSEKQVKAIRPAIEREIKGAQIRAQREASKASLIASGVRAPEGRISFEGEIIAVKYQESEFGTVEKIVVKTSEGWSAYVSTHAGIVAEKGSVIRLTATLTPSGTDPLFCFGKRPAKAEIVGQESTPISEEL